MGLAIHHGGVSSFTETIHAGKSTIVLPFSSDQFDVARDVQDNNLGAVLNPNTFTLQELNNALEFTREVTVRNSVASLSNDIRQRGPAWTARQLLLNEKEVL